MAAIPPYSFPNQIQGSMEPPVSDRTAQTVLNGSAWIKNLSNRKPIPLAQRLYQRLFPNRVLKEKVETLRLEKLASVLQLQLTGPNRGKKIEGGAPFTFSSRRMGGNWETQLIDQTYFAYTGKHLGPDVNEKFQRDYKDCCYFISGAVQLAKKLEQNLPLQSVQKIREAICSLTESPVYLKLLDADHPAVNFVQFLSIKLHTADGQSVLREYASGRLGVGALSSDPSGLHSMAHLGEAVGQALLNSKNYHRNHKLASAWWGLHHPSQVLDLRISNHDPLHYNPHRANPSYLGPEFTRKNSDGTEKSIRSYYAPSLVGDRIAEFGLIPAYRKLGIFEIYFNYQDTSHRAELKRIQEIDRLTSKNSDCMQHVLLGFDTKAKHESTKKLFKRFSTVEEFIEGYRAFVMSDMRQVNTKTGFSIPKKLLSDTQMEGIFDLAKQVFVDLQLNEVLQDGKFRKRFREQMGKMMILAIDALIGSAILYQAFNDPRVKGKQDSPDLDPDLASCYLSARCKQHIDRGAVESNALRLFYRLFENDAYLTTQEFLEISGGILGRAPNVENRDILYRRYEPFQFLMNLIGTRQEKLAEHLRNYRDQYLKPIRDC